MNFADPRILAVKANALDNPTWNQAMNGPDSEGFWEACEEELQTLKDMDAWEVVNRQDHMQILGST